jgi:alpha-amylase
MVLMTSACQDTATTPPPNGPTLLGTGVLGVTVAPGSATLNAGDRMTFVASVSAEAAVTDRTVTWSSSNTSIASVDANGVVTAGSVPGTTTIKASSKADPTVSGAAAVTVTAGGPAPAVTSYGVSLAVSNDPASEERFTRYASVKDVTATVTGSTIVITGPSPWVTVAGTLSPTNTFTATGVGTVAGNPNVQVTFSGTCTANGITGTVVLGPGLPSNQTETLALTGSRK